jgi:putative inorganic carbon (HCO3(-)) transporter
MDWLIAGSGRFDRFVGSVAATASLSRVAVDAVSSRDVQMTRCLPYCLLVVTLAAAVLLKGGVDPQQWQWCAAVIGVASILFLVSRGARLIGRSDAVVPNTLLGLLLAWMVFQLLPLPMNLVGRLSPQRWLALMAARLTIGANPASWAALSLAPSASIERLLDIVPAMAAFVAAQRMGLWLKKRMWIAVAPVIAVAWVESIMGLVQFYSLRGGAQVESATGTYVNRDHFAGLLEMALPLAFLWLIFMWRRVTTRSDQSANLGLRAASLVGIVACLLAGLVVSLSRMGFISTLIAAGVTTFLMLISVRSGQAGWRTTWKWLLPLAVPLLAILLLPTRQLTARLTDLTQATEASTDNRIDIWRETLHVAPAYKWAGSGLGAYERAMYLRRSVAPTNTLDFAHNDYLQVYMELGVFGSALAGGLLAFILWRPVVVILLGRESRHWELAAGLFAALLSLSLHGLADFNLYIPANALAFAWLGGLAVSPGLQDT